MLEVHHIFNFDDNYFKPKAKVRSLDIASFLLNKIFINSCTYLLVKTLVAFDHLVIEMIDE